MKIYKKEKPGAILRSQGLGALEVYTKAHKEVKWLFAFVMAAVPSASRRDWGCAEQGRGHRPPPRSSPGDCLRWEALCLGRFPKEGARGSAARAAAGARCGLRGGRGAPCGGGLWGEAPHGADRSPRCAQGLPSPTEPTLCCPNPTRCGQRHARQQESCHPQRRCGWC